MKRPTETEIAEPVVHYLRDLGWEVYQEVAMDGRVADIVATRGSLVRIVEVKTSFSVALLEQALSWKGLGYAHFVHVAAPSPRLRRGRWGRLHPLQRLCRHEGVGYLRVRVLTATERAYGWQEVYEEERSRLNRRIFGRLRDSLCEEQKTWAAAGCQAGKRYSPWKATCEAWAQFVREHPGCNLGECIKIAGHHYRSDSTCRSSMAQWIRAGQVPGIEVRMNGRLIELWPPEVP